MAGTYEQNTIGNHDCWEVPVNGLTLIPKRQTTIEIDRRPIVLKNMRRFGVPEHLQPPANERDAAIHGLMTVFRDGQGHGGQFEDAHVWDGAQESVRGHDVDDDVIKGHKRGITDRYHEMRLRSYGTRLAELNGYTRQETGLWVAFRHPDNRDRNVMALARVAGVALDDTREDLAIGLLVEGRSALEGDKSGEPLGLPLPRAQAFPYIEVS